MSRAVLKKPRRLIISEKDRNQLYPKRVSSTGGSESENKVQHTLINIIIEYVRVNAKYCLYTAILKSFPFDLCIGKPNKPEGRGALNVAVEDLRKCTRKSRQEKKHYLRFRTN